jgi:hypothetical protein
MIDAEKFEKDNKNLELIHSDEVGSWAVSLYYNKDDGHYYMKGPFARWDAICYIDKGLMTNDQIEEFKKRYPKNPKVIT